MADPVPSLAAKFRNGQDAALHGGKIVGRTAEGYPVLGQRAPLLVGDQIDEIAVVSTYRTRMFKMWDEADVGEFCSLMDAISNGGGLIRRRREFEVPAPGGEPGGHLKIWLEWVLFSGVLPGTGGFRPMDPPPPGVTTPIGRG